MHPLCCISINCPVIADPDPAPAAGAPDNTNRSYITVVEFLHKWTNFSWGWISRRFSLRNGVLSYTKIHPPPPKDPDSNLNEDFDPPTEDVRLNGSASASCYQIGQHQQQKPIGFVYLKISSFRECRSDDRRFYIFSPTKTLHLRTDSKEDYVTWIEALVSARIKFSLNDKLFLVQHDLSFSTMKLINRMHSEGLEIVQGDGEKNRCCCRTRRNFRRDRSTDNTKDFQSGIL